MTRQIRKINGPINVVRMEGKINNISKVIYIFMDEHVDVEKQTNCDDPNNAVDINNFFKTSFERLKNNNRTYDFFLETFPSHLAYEPAELGYSNDDNKRIYIDSLAKFFYEHVKFDKESNKLTSLFENVRLHYIDIRDMLYYFLVHTWIFAEKKLEDVHRHDYVPAMIETTVRVILETMKIIEDILRTNNFEAAIGPNKIQTITRVEHPVEHFLLKPDIRKNYIKIFLYSLNKLVNHYQHDDVKKIVNYYIQYYFLVEWHRYIDELSRFYNKIIYLAPEDYRNPAFLEDLRTEIDRFDRSVFSKIARLVDLYFIRRFLDKDYVTNAIVYTGAAHSVAFIYILNSIGFQITHCANCEIKNMDELNKAVSEIKNFPFKESQFDLMDIFVKGEGSQQCSDISDFPKDFL